jgi:hypothetical protein
MADHGLAAGALWQLLVDSATAPHSQDARQVEVLRQFCRENDTGWRAEVKGGVARDTIHVNPWMNAARRWWRDQTPNTNQTLYFIVQEGSPVSSIIASWSTHLASLKTMSSLSSLKTGISLPNPPKTPYRLHLRSPLRLSNLP